MWPSSLEYELPGDVSCISALNQFFPDLRVCHMLIRTDNTSVISYLNRQGGKMFPLPVEISEVQSTLDTWVKARRVEVTP